MNVSRHLHLRRPGRSRARRGDGDLLRKELLEASEQLLLEKGRVEAVSMRDIAKRVGCSPPAIYLHFESKDELFLATCSRRFEEFNSSVMVALAEKETIVGRLEALARAYIRYGVENPTQYRVLFASGPLVPPEGEEELPGVDGFMVLIAAVEAAMEEGELRDGDPMAVAFALWSVVHGAVMLLMEKDEYPHGVPMPELEVLIETVVSMALDGITP